MIKYKRIPTYQVITSAVKIRFCSLFCSKAWNRRKGHPFLSFKAWNSRMASCFSSVTWESSSHGFLLWP